MVVVVVVGSAVVVVVPGDGVVVVVVGNGEEKHEAPSQRFTQHWSSEE